MVLTQVKTEREAFSLARTPGSGLATSKLRQIASNWTGRTRRQHLQLDARGVQGAPLPPRVALLLRQPLELPLQLRELELLALPAEIICVRSRPGTVLSNGAYAIGAGRTRRAPFATVHVVHTVQAGRIALCGANTFVRKADQHLMPSGKALLGATVQPPRAVIEQQERAAMCRPTAAKAVCCRPSATALGYD